MESFFKLYLPFKSATSGKVIKTIYRHSSLMQKCVLWVAPAAYIVFGLLCIFAHSKLSYLAIAAFFALLWIGCFQLALRSFSANLPIANPLFFKFYEKDHQLIRYQFFSADLQNFKSIRDIDMALDHINTELITSPNPTIFSPFVKALSALFLAVISAVIGNIDKQVLTAIVLILGISVVIGYALHGFKRSRVDDLREFQRFLIWKKRELESENSSL